MLDRNLVEEKMKERGFTLYASIGGTKLQFVSDQMYHASSNDSQVSKRNRVPVINIVVNLENEEFQCTYNLSKSLSRLITPTCGSVMNDSHFDSIVSKFESEAKWLSRLTD